MSILCFQNRFPFLVFGSHSVVVIDQAGLERTVINLSLILKSLDYA